MSEVRLTVKTTRRYGRAPIVSIQKDVRGNSAMASYNFARHATASARRRVHVITGFLRESIQHERIGYGHHRVWVGAHYGVYEEYGTRHRPPHPFFRPAIQDARRSFERDILKVFKTGGVTLR